MKISLFILMGCLFLGLHAAGADNVTVEATMILASDDAAPIDRRLERVEFQLRRIFQFQYYHFVGNGQALLAMPGETALELGQGHRLLISASEGKGKVRAHVRWMRGDEPLLTTTVGIKRGSPVILGGVPHDGGTLIVTLMAR